MSYYILDNHEKYCQEVENISWQAQNQQLKYLLNLSKLNKKLRNKFPREYLKKFHKSINNHNRRYEYDIFSSP